jgi:hypothetical protein
VLVAVTLVACLPAALLGNWLYGRAGVWAALTAAGLCVAGSVLGLVVVTLLRGQQAFAGVLAAMLPRMFVPLAGAVALRLSGGPLYEAGALYFVVGFYLLTLAAETLWLLPPGGLQGAASPPTTPPSQSVAPSQTA